MAFQDTLGSKTASRKNHTHQYAYLEVFETEDDPLSSLAAEYEEPKNRRAARKSEQAQTRRRRHYDFY